MKKSIYLALAVTTMALFACNSKPAESDQQSEEQVVQEAPASETPAEAEEAPVEEADSLAAESADSIATEAVAAEEPAAEEPAPAEEPDEEETVFMVVESMAVPPCSGAEMAQLLTVDLNKVDPEASNCRVIVGVVVEKDGRLTHHEAKRSNCNNEKLEAYAIKLVQEKLPRFKEPARQRNQPVRSSYMIPVSFKK